MNNALRITASSRLHFGLLRFAQPKDRSFGGLGMMINRPRVVVKVRISERWSASGLYAQRALECARQALESCPSSPVRALGIDVLEVPAPHSGLGSGTQLALAVAAGVRELCGSPAGSIEELASSVQRGARSAVGSHGFEHGGLIWEGGRLPEQSLGELQSRVAVPDSWRVVLATFPNEQGLSGVKESQAFEQLPPVPNNITDRLIQLAESQILPAAASNDFDHFAAAVYEYGHLAGSCFSAFQGGPFASTRLAAAVKCVRELGVLGVGQSSWGPTLFAFVPHEEIAFDLIERLEQTDEFADARLIHSSPGNRGARIEPCPAQVAVN